MIAETANWFFATFVVNYCPILYPSANWSITLIKFREVIFFIVSYGPALIEWVNVCFR